MLLTKREEQLLKAFLHVGKLSMQDMKSYRSHLEQFIGLYQI